MSRISISPPASNFPEFLIKNTDRVLSLFSAAFLGRNDLHYIHKAKPLSCIIVDQDAEKLIECQKKYGYTPIVCDAFELIKSAQHIGVIDIVVSDQWTTLDERVWSMITELKQIALRVLIIGICQKNMHLLYSQPDFDKWKTMKRSEHEGGVYWAWRVYAD